MKIGSIIIPNMDGNRALNLHILYQSMAGNRALNLHILVQMWDHNGNSGGDNVCIFTAIYSIFCELHGNKKTHQFELYGGKSSILDYTGKTNSPI